jgi:hypothetical protein
MKMIQLYSLEGIFRPNYGTATLSGGFLITKSGKIRGRVRMIKNINFKKPETNWRRIVGRQFSWRTGSN